MPTAGAPARPTPTAGPRFDRAALRPPEPAADELDWPGFQPQAWARLQGWVHWTGDAPGAGLPLSVATLTGADAGQLAACAAAFARELDGSLRLARLGRAAGLLWRLSILLRERLPGARPATLPWDAGWARTDADGMAQLAHRFQPRRPTLVLADAGERHALAPVLAALSARAGGLARPLRWLWVEADDLAGLHDGGALIRLAPPA